MCRGEDCFVSFLHVREKLYLDFSNATTKYKVDRETNPITFFSFFFHSLFFTRLTQNHLYTYHIFLNNFQVSKKFKRPCITVQLWNSRVNYILLRAQINNTSCRIKVRFKLEKLKEIGKKSTATIPKRITFVKLPCMERLRFHCYFPFSCARS